MSRTIQLYYSDSKANLGDAVNPALLEHLLDDCRIKHADFRSAEIFALGSILGKLTAARGAWIKRLRSAFSAPVTVWSSGFIDQLPANMVLTRPVKVLALRGEKTRQIMEKLLGRRLDVPLGDGGLLMPELLTDMPEKKYATGIVPHYKEVNDTAIALLQQKIPDSVIISPLGDPADTLRRIAQCRTIVSSSLHGLIAADAMNIPSLHISAGDQIRGGMFKYQDYYSAYGLDTDCISIDDLLKNPPDESFIARRYRISFDQVQELQENLRSALLQAYWR